MGNPDQPHSYSYTPDVAAGLVALAHPARRNRIGMAPADRRNPYHPTGHRPRLPGSPATGHAVFAAGATTLRLLGLVKPAMREYLHTLYQFTDRWVVDDTRFRAAFGDLSTPLDAALDATLTWYRDAATPALESIREGRAMTMQTTRRLAATLLAAAAALAIAGFTALGSVFDYPQILDATDRRDPRRLPGAPGRDHRLVPRPGRQRGTARPGRRPARTHRRRDARWWIAGIGIAAAAVQVVGLSRWVLLIPRVSADATVPAKTADAHRTFELLHTWLGKVLGETIGYALTATLTVLIVLGSPAPSPRGG